MPEKICSIEGCSTAVEAHGWCGKHYQRWRRHGDPEGSALPREQSLCDMSGCTQPSRSRGWCNAHYLRWRHHGSPDHGREYIHENAQEDLRKRGLKSCSCCSEILPLASFDKRERSSDRLRAECKACRTTDYYENPSTAKERSRLWYAKNRERVAERARRYREANRESIAADKILQRLRNPEQVAARRARYRARKRGAPVVESGLTWRAVAERGGMNCAYCGVLTVPKHEDARLWPTLDHVIPLSRGGHHALSNGVLACKSCNSSKQDKTLDEWAGPGRD